MTTTYKVVRKPKFVAGRHRWELETRVPLTEESWMYHYDAHHTKLGALLHKAMKEAGW